MPNPETIRRQQRTLSELMRQEQEQRAYQSRTEGLNALSSQMRQHRLGMLQGRQQISEQGWAAQRAIGQQASQRGLGSSGLRDMSMIQSQIASGRATNELEGQNAAVQSEALRARQALQRNYQGDLRTADLQYREGMLGADRELMSSRERALGQLGTLFSLAQSGSFTEQQLASLVSTMNLGDLMSGEGGDVMDILGGQMPHPESGETLKRQYDWKDFADTMVNAYLGVPSSRPKYRYMIGGSQYSWGTPEEAQQGLTELFSSRPMSDRITIKVWKSGKVRFMYNDEQHKTYNEALDKAQGRG